VFDSHNPSDLRTFASRKRKLRPVSCLPFSLRREGRRKLGKKHHARPPRRRELVAAGRRRKEKKRNFAESGKGARPRLRIWRNLCLCLSECTRREKRGEKGKKETPPSEDDFGLAKILKSVYHSRNWLDHRRGKEGERKKPTLLERIFCSRF